jgi:hypothetical protein
MSSSYEERYKEPTNLYNKKIYNNINKGKTYTKLKNYNTNKTKRQNQKDKVLRKSLKTLSKHYKKKIISITESNLFGINKTLNDDDIKNLAKYLKVLNTVYSRCNNDKNIRNIYDYLKTEINLIKKEDKKNVELFIDNIRYSYKGQDAKKIINERQDIKKAFTTVLENMPNCKV